VFADTLSLTIPDPDHSDEEERWVIIGESHRRRLLGVVQIEEDDTVRITSGRDADRDEPPATSISRTRAVAAVSSTEISSCTTSPGAPFLPTSEEEARSG
jgi:uncharacterized DUF497 family protein